MQAALEAEVTEFPGRDRYQRAGGCADARPGSRNGYREVTVKTTAGPAVLSRPKLRGTTQAFASGLVGAHGTKTNALESLVIASFVRGLPARGVEAALAGAPGDQAAVSQSAVSAICGQVKQEYQAWAERRLDGARLDYLVPDASFFRMHPGSPAGMQSEVKDACRKLFGTGGLTTPPGPRLAELVDARISEMAARYQATYPPAMKCLLTGKQGPAACLRFPAGHHNRVRHSTFIERTFGETRRRVKVTGRLPGETSCLTPVRAVPDRACRGRRGFTMTCGGLRLPQDLRRPLLEPPRQLRPRTATPAQAADHPETGSTVA